MQAAALSAVLATTAVAAPHPFYQSMLQRGAAQVSEGRYTDAIRSLRIAAFGSLDDLGAYQLAQVYLVIAHEKLGNSDDARLAATKFIQAERIQPSYGQLGLSDGARESFEKIVAAAVEPEYLAQLPGFRRSSAKSTGSVATRGTDLPAASQPERQPEAAVPPPPPKKDEQPPTTSAPAVREQKPAPEALKAPPPATPKPSEITTRLAEAQRLLHEGKLLAARNAYIALTERRDVPRPQLLEIARGLNRTGAWQESAMIYQRALPLIKGEELHMFYEAVNRYELGELTLARALLGKALPSLPQSREVESYRAKIQGSL